MLNAQTEIGRLRHLLLYGEVPIWKVDKICLSAAQEIDAGVTQLVADALEDVAIEAVKIGADEFVQQLTVQEIGGRYEITTSSGITDFSEDSKSMIPDLLKNADISKDGHRYKRIPVGKPSGRMKLDIFDVQQNIDRARRQADVDTTNNRSDNPGRSVATFSGALDMSLLKKRHSIPEVGGEVDIKTVTDKQDQSSQWVRPAKDMDMTALLGQTNKQLEQDVDNVIKGVIYKYESMI